MSINTDEAYDPLNWGAQHEARTEKDEATRLKRQIEVDDLKWLMGHKQGRRYVWRQLEEYGVFRSSFRVEPVEMAFLEGARNHGCKLIAAIHEHCPDRYVEMLKDQKDHGRRNRNIDERNATSSSE